MGLGGLGVHMNTRANGLDTLDRSDSEVRRFRKSLLRPVGGTLDGSGP
jgi:hypothetical protein